MVSNVLFKGDFHGFKCFVQLKNNKKINTCKIAGINHVGVGPCSKKMLRIQTSVPISATERSFY